jgi:riboflavin synthase
MFTGIIRKTGVVRSIENGNGLKTLTIEMPENPTPQPAMKNGDSIAVDGCCLTVTSHDKNSFTVEAIEETLNKTIINGYKKGTVVNLENPLRIGDSLDGHLVQGHIDFVTTIIKTAKEGEAKIVTIHLPLLFAKFIALKGSVTVNGVSLTVSGLNSESFEVSLIPETQKSTSLGYLEKDSKVNVEIDTIARYLDSLLQDKAKETTYNFLQERGFI